MCAPRPLALMHAVVSASAALVRARGPAVHGARAPTLRMMQVNTGSLGAPDICVLGGGFGGLYTALRLSKLDWGDAPRPRVTLVDQQDRFVFLPMLYEVTTGSASCWEVAPPFPEVLAGSGVEFVQGTVAGLDTDSQLVRVAGCEGEAERLLPYDACVLALGARAVTGQVPGAAEFARQFYTLDDALELRRELQVGAPARHPTRTPPASGPCRRAALTRSCAASAAAAGQTLRTRRRGGLLRVAVVGTGYIGTELSANLASWLGPSQLALTLVGSGDELLASGLQHNRGVAKRELDAKGVQARALSAHLGPSSHRLTPSTL